jgi:hypothetical protein
MKKKKRTTLSPKFEAKEVCPSSDDCYRTILIFIQTKTIERTPRTKI